MQRAAIIVAGGGGTRLGGVDKPRLLVDGRSLLDHVCLAAAAWVTRLVIVGYEREIAPISAQVHWVLEEPVGSGPAAAVRAAMPLLAEIDEVLLLAGDAPFAADALQALCAAPFRADGVALKHDGMVQFLASRLRADALRHALTLGGQSLRSVFDHLQIDTLEGRVVDADTWEDVVHLRAKGLMAMARDPWLEEVATVLGLDPVIDIDAVLALTRDVAHNVERKYAPLTSYLLGYAAAARGLDAAAIAELAERIGAQARARGGADA